MISLAILEGLHNKVQLHNALSLVMTHQYIVNGIVAVTFSIIWVQKLPYTGFPNVVHVVSLILNKFDVCIFLFVLVFFKRGSWLFIYLLSISFDHVYPLCVSCWFFCFVIAPLLFLPNCNSSTIRRVVCIVLICSFLMFDAFKISVLLWFPWHEFIFRRKKIWFSFNNFYLRLYLNVDCKKLFHFWVKY